MPPAPNATDPTVPEISLVATPARSVSEAVAITTAVVTTVKTMVAGPATREKTAILSTICRVLPTELTTASIVPFYRKN
jgi:hypothetical protein